MKRMQVLFEPAEYRALLSQARSRGLTLAEWVRQALRAAMRSQPSRNRERRLAAVRAAAAHEFPTADIEQMLAESMSGRSELPEDHGAKPRPVATGRSPRRPPTSGRRR